MTDGKVSGWRAREPGPKVSAILRGLADDTVRDRVAVSDLVGAMGDRAFGPLLFVFALPNILPAPPGTSGVLGIPLVFLAGQLMLGRQPWLPGFILRRSIGRVEFARFVDRAMPWLARAERLLWPRLGLLVHPPAEYGIGAMCLLLALVLCLPIPFANATPAFTICLFAMGILGRDGVWVLAGLVMSAVSIALSGALGYGLFVAIGAGLSRLFG